MDSVIVSQNSVIVIGESVIVSQNYELHISYLIAFLIFLMGQQDDSVLFLFQLNKWNQNYFSIPEGMSSIQQL